MRISDSVVFHSPIMCHDLAFEKHSSREHAHGPFSKHLFPSPIHTWQAYNATPSVMKKCLLLSVPLCWRFWSLGMHHYVLNHSFRRPAPWVSDLLRRWQGRKFAFLTNVQADVPPPGTNVENHCPIYSSLLHFVHKPQEIPKFHDWFLLLFFSNRICTISWLFSYYCFPTILASTGFPLAETKLCICVINTLDSAGTLLTPAKCILTIVLLARFLTMTLSCSFSSFVSSECTTVAQVLV